MCDKCKAGGKNLGKCELRKAFYSKDKDKEIKSRIVNITLDKGLHWTCQTCSLIGILEDPSRPEWQTLHHGPEIGVCLCWHLGPGAGQSLPLP